MDGEKKMIVLKQVQDPSKNIFANYVADYVEQGLIAFPVGADKKPLVKNWQSFKENTCGKMLDRFPDANIGFLNGEGRSPLTIVDIDDPALLHDAYELFGKTTIIIRTPNGGYHLWYKHNNEPRKIRYKGMKIDILGSGGFTVAPPSRNLQGGSYAFLEGDATDIPYLPQLKALITSTQATNNNNDVGGRNTRLFDCLRSIARDCDTELALLENAFQFNKTLIPSLSDEEVSVVE